ncbi:MATE efflux family protein [Nitrosococcus halophilus Nc 4]|uniref:Multidrug-efflux transporter n=1 Tax=Nitrosococcus halophilus (strain Nc4) TaxID=472759 RepID=D5BWT9_NITHN|nr:MATE family efflux transporter [Nitrosococcus halophilus]ADE13820.1 MATE efflux family protein [Nitrosococcus halophilus Nc 4]
MAKHEGQAQPYLEPLPPIGLRPLLALAIPSAVFAFLTNGFRIVDQYFIQGVSVEAQAAIGSSAFVLIFTYATFEVFAAGAGPLIARATGAHDPLARRTLLGEAIYGALLLTMLLMVLGTLGAPMITHTLGLEGQSAIECTRYLRTLFLTILPLVLTPLVDQTFISMGSARPPLLLHTLSLGLNIILTPLLIHEAGLGIVGAALASNIARGIGVGIGLILLKRITGLTFEDLKPRGQLRRIMRIGTPMALGTAFFAIVYWGLLKTSVSPLGTHVNAALGIGFSALEGCTWPLFHGLSLGAASLAGRYLGARRPDLARRTFHMALPLATLLGLAASLIFFFAGEALTALFTDDIAVHRAATEYAVILAASQLFLAWEALSEGILAGAGDTRTVFWYSTPFNLIRVPLAWLFAFPMGFEASGIWWAINVTTYAKALFKGWAVWQGRWTTIEP